MDDQPLDTIGILEGTDKTSLGHDYLRHYQRIFAAIRNDPIMVLEIGIAGGASLRTWARFFPRATIVGVDIDAACRNFAGDRITVEIGSQDDRQFLAELASKYQPDIVIDDGSHLAGHILLTFDHLFPSLAPGGSYIVEDLYAHYGAFAAGYHPTGGATPAEHFAGIARRIAADYLEPDADAATRYLRRSIDRVEFIRRAVIVQKRRPVDPMEQLTDAWDLLEAAGRAGNWMLLSRNLIVYRDFARAEIAAQRAVTLEPRNPECLLHLAHTQELAGKLPAAVETLRQAVRLAPDDRLLAAELQRHEATL